MKKIAIIDHSGYGSKSILKAIGSAWMKGSLKNNWGAGVKPEDAVNRIGSSLGAMALAGNKAPETAFVPGDLKTAKLFGARFAEVVASH